MMLVHVTHPEGVKLSFVFLSNARQMCMLQTEVNMCSLSFSSLSRAADTEQTMTCGSIQGEKLST